MQHSPTTKTGKLLPSPARLFPLLPLFLHLLPILLGLLLVPHSGFTQEDELYEQAFGDNGETSGNAPATMPLALYLDSRYIGEVDARIEARGTAKIGMEMFVSSIREYIHPELAETLLSLSEEEYITPEAVSKSNIDVEYRREHLELHVDIPPELRKTKVTSLQSRRRIPDSLSPEASAFSAYMNMELETQLFYDNYGDGTDLQYPFFVALQPNIQLFSWVVENRTTYDTDDIADEEGAVKLDYARLVKDFPTLGLRLNAGTISAPAGGFLGSFDMLGASVGTEEALKKAFEGEGLFAQEIIIEEPAELVIYMNGRVIKRTRVEPGPHKLLDFPFVSGLNTVRIELVREDGTVELLSESVPFDSGLLEPGEVSFSAGAGTLRRDSGTAAASGFFSYGLGETTTAGLFLQSGLLHSDLLQSGPGNHTGGAELIQATGIGNFSGTAGFSYDKDKAIGYSGRIRYRLAFPRHTFLPSFSASARYTSPSYMSNISIAAEEVENTNRWRFSAQIGQSLPLNAHASLFLGYTVGTAGIPDTTAGSFSLLKSIGNSASLSAHYSLQHKSTGDINWEAGLYMTVYPGDSEGSSRTVMYGQNLKTGEGRVSYSAAGGNTGGENTYYSLGLQGFPPSAEERTTARGVYRYTHDKFRSSLRSSVSVRPEGETEQRSISNRSSLSFSTALLYAEGLFGLSKPPYDSFLFVAPEGRLQEETLSVRTAEGGGSARETKGGNIIFNDLQSYRPVSLSLDTPESPPETGLMEENIQLLPSYKSGHVIRPRIRETISVEGTLLTLNKKPIPFQAGEIRAADPPEGEPPEGILFFTNGEGVFRLYDVEPGEYKLHLYAERITGSEITVPEDKESPYRLGEIVLPVVLKQNTLEAQ